MSFTKEIIYAFIDSQNINLGIRKNNWKLDWGKFRLFLRNKYGVKKAFLFIGYIRKNENLYKYLEKVGYILVFKKVLAVRKDHKVVYKGNVDAELVLHTMVELENYDKAIIASGDGDFYCLVEYLDDEDKLLLLLVPNKKYSALLRRFNRYVVDMSYLRDSLGK